MSAPKTATKPAVPAAPDWRFAPPPATKPGAFQSDLVTHIRERAVAVAEEAARFARTAPEARATFAFHHDVASAAAELGSRIKDLLEVGPRIAAREERSPLTAAEACAVREIPELERVQLIALAKAGRSDAGVRSVILEILARIDATEPERQLQRAFVRTGLAALFGPDAIAVREKIVARLRSAANLAGLDNIDQQRMRSEFDRRPLTPDDLVARDREDSAPQLAQLVSLAEASRDDETTRAAVRQMLTRADPDGIERPLQLVFLRSCSAAMFGADGLAARAVIMDRIQGEMISELRACAELQAEIVRSGEADPATTLASHQRCVPPSRWSADARAWAASGLDLRDLEARVASALAEARAAAPCRSCSGEGQVREGGGSTRQCGRCDGTGSSNRAKAPAILPDPAGV